MRKILSFSIIVFFLSLVIITSFVSAEKTVKTVEIPIGYYPSVNPFSIYQSNFTVDFPDGISEILSLEYTVKGDYTSTSSIFGGIVLGGQVIFCEPMVWVTPNQNVYNYEITYDCSNLIKQSGWKGSADVPLTFAIYSDKAASNVKPRIKMTYYNRPIGNIQVHGTEYNDKQIAKVWLQLIDSDGNYVNDGVCYADIFNPNGVHLIDKAIMLHLEKGIYFYNLPLIGLIEGVYPVVARCYYSAIQEYYNVSSYSVIRGSYDKGDVPLDTSLIDGDIIRFKESGINPTRNITIVFNMSSSICSNVSEDLLTGISINTYAKFDSVINDDITLSIYNYSSNSWVDLNNKLPEGKFFSFVSNALEFNNITKVGFSTPTQPVRIQFRDVGNLADGATSNLDIDYLQVSCNQLANPDWQEVKGSSEIHITHPSGDDLFVHESLCGESGISDCSLFMYNLSYANFTWGYIYDSITYYNSYQTDLDTFDVYQTPFKQDCTSLLDIIEVRNNVRTSVLDNITASFGDNSNCAIKFPVIMNSSENDIYYEITMENYMTWEVQRTQDLVSYYRLPIESFCNDVAISHGVTYQLPITGGIDVSTLYRGNPILLGCYRTYDDLYWFDYYYNSSRTINISGEYESYLYNVIFYYEELKDGSNAVAGIIGNNVLINTYASCGPESPTDYSCGAVKSPDAIFGSQEGYVLQNITAVNVFNATVSGKFTYETAQAMDCTAVFQVLKKNGTTTDIIDDLRFKAGSNDNCIITIPIDYVEGQSSYIIEVYLENYILWDIYWARDKVNGWNDTIVDFCSDVATNRSITYNLPINASIEAYRNDSEVYFCYRAMDNLYWWYFFYDLMITSNYTTIGPLESIHYESEFFWTKIFQDYNTVLTLNRNLNQIQTLDEILSLRDNLANRVWNFNQSRNLTYYAPVSINNTELAESIWNYNGTISVNILNQIGTAIWTYSGDISIILDAITSAVTNSVWTFTNRTLTDYNQSDLTDYNLIQTMVWNATNRNLTYYENFGDQTNYTLIQEMVWDATNRTLTEFNFDVNVNVTAIANAVWESVNRTLTYYPTESDLTNYTLIQEVVWAATTRTLTEFDFTVNVNQTQLDDLTIDYNLIQEMVWNATTRTLTEFNFSIDVNTTAIADAVWASANRSLSYYPEWADLTNYTLIQEVVWDATDRTLTEFNFTIETNNTNIAEAVWQYTNKTVQFANGSVDTVGDIRDMGHVYVGGTEYLEGDNGKVAIRLVRGTGSLAEIETGANCSISIVYPNTTYYIFNATMTEVGLGAYTYDFTVPTILGVYSYFTNCLVEDRKYFSLDTFHVYDFEAVWNNPSRTLTDYGNDITASDVWTSPTRELTYYPTVNLTLSNDSVQALGEAVWQYEGDINSNLINQFGNVISCKINNLLNNLNSNWGVHISSCSNSGVIVG